jgi:hypothetical protein
MEVPMDHKRVLRITSTLAAVGVIVDTIGVGAPFLGLAAVPFVAALLLLERSPRIAAAFAGLGGLVVGGTAALYQVHGGPGWTVDIFYVYLAGPLALVGLIAAVGVLSPRRFARG